MKKIILILSICLSYSIAEAQIWGGIFNPPQGTLNSSVTLSTNLTATIGGVDIRKISPVYFVDNTAYSIYSSSSTTGLAWTLSPLNEVTLLTTTIKGGDMGSNGKLKVETFWTFPAASNTRTLRVKLGSSTIAFGYYQPTATITLVNMLSMITNTNPSGQLTPVGIGPIGFNAVAASPVYTSINTLIDQPLVITAQTTTEALKTSTACSAATVTAICGSTPTVTCTVSANGYNTGEYAEVTGATPTFYNQAVALIKTALTNTLVYCATGATNTTTSHPSFSRYSPLTVSSCHIQILR